jgi:hypothetical protein
MPKPTKLTRPRRSATPHAIIDAVFGDNEAIRNSLIEAVYSDFPVFKERANAVIDALNARPDAPYRLRHMSDDLLRVFRADLLSDFDTEPALSDEQRLKEAAEHASYCIDEPRKQVAVKGVLVMHAPRNVFFGGDKSQPYTSAVLTDPTWARLCAEFKKQMVVTRDTPHLFFEGVYKTDREIDGVPVYQFNAGS